MLPFLVCAMDDLVMDWKKELGWETNPFEHKILPHDYLAGYQKEQQELNLFILNEKKFGIIEGASGTGKTALLHWFFGQLSKQKKFLTVFLKKEDVKTEESFIVKLSEPFASEAALSLFFKKLVGKEGLSAKNISSFIKDNLKKRQLIILADYEPRTEDLEVFSRLLKIAGVSIIVVNPKKDTVKALGRDELGIELTHIDFAGAMLLIQKRIEAVGGTGIWPFNEKQLKDLCGLADYVPLRILNLCAEKAKELALEVRTGKIKKPEKKHFVVEHEVHYENAEVHHPLVEKKHKDGGFGITFTIVDDSKPHVSSEPHAAIPAPEKTSVLMHVAQKKIQTDTTHKITERPAGAEVQQVAEMYNVESMLQVAALQRDTEDVSSHPVLEAKDDDLIVIDFGIADITPRKEPKVIRGEELIVEVKKKK